MIFSHTRLESVALFGHSLAETCKEFTSSISPIQVFVAQHHHNHGHATLTGVGCGAAERASILPSSIMQYPRASASHVPAAPFSIVEAFPHVYAAYALSSR